MDFKQLEAFVKVIELSSFSKAADAIYLSQPSVSAYISALEKEFKTQLIYRSTKELLPTKSGKMLYGYSKNMLSLRDKAVKAVNSLSDATVGGIDILASSVPAQYILPDILAAFNMEYPNITFSLNQADTVEVINGISIQKCDVGFVGAKLDNPKCVYEYFTSEKLVIVTPYEERFQKIAPDGIENIFYGERFIMREAGSGTRLRYEEFMREIGIRPEKLNTVACFNNTQGIIHAVSKGLGISIVSELAAKYYVNQKMINQIQLNCELPYRDFYIVVKKKYSISPAAELFINFARKYYEGSKSI